MDRFVIDRVPLGVDLELSASHHELRTSEPRLSRVGEASILRLEPANCVSLSAASSIPLAGRLLVPACICDRGGASIPMSGMSWSNLPPEPSCWQTLKAAFAPPRS